MLPRRWMEAYVSFLLHYRWPVLALALAITLFLTSQLVHTTLQMNFLDLYPPSHPYLQLYKKHARMFGSSNVLVIAVEVKEGDIFTVETLNKIARLTTTLMATPGVNPWQVLSISHPKARHLRVTSAGIDLMPLFSFGPPKTPQDAARIKKAVYTTDGILDFLVSRDNKAALITAGFWETSLNFGRMTERLFQLPARRDLSA